MTDEANLHCARPVAGLFFTYRTKFTLKQCLTTFPRLRYNDSFALTVSGDRGKMHKATRVQVR